MSISKRKLAEFGLEPDPRIKMEEGIYFWQRNREESSPFFCELPLCDNRDPIRIGLAYNARWVSEYFVVTSMYLEPINFIWRISGYYYEDGVRYEEEELYIDAFKELAF